MAWEDPGTSALIVDVPSAMAVVDRFRHELTPSGREGMPPHITLLAPFTTESFLTAVRIREVRDVLGQFPAFQFELTALARFDDRTLYLAPEPFEPFVAMHGALVEAFPEHRPHGRPEMVPHLTAASGKLADERRIEAVRAEIEEQLPVEAVAREVLLMVRDEGRRWITRSTIELR